MKIDPDLKNYFFRTKDLWIDQISKYSPLSQETLSNCSEYLNWFLVSQNRSIRWTPEIVRKFQDKWEWEKLTRNKSLYKRIKDIEPLIIEFSDYWSWKHLQRHKPHLLSNELIAINRKRYKKYHCKISNHVELCKLRFPEDVNDWLNIPLEQWKNIPDRLKNTFDLDIEFLERNKKKVNWDVLSTFCGWPKQTISHFEKYWNWKILSGNKYLTKHIEFIMTHKSKWVWPIFKTGRNYTNRRNVAFYRDEYIVKKLPEFFSSEFEGYHFLIKPITPKVIDYFYNEETLWIRINLFHSDSIIWTREMYKKYELDWKVPLMKIPTKVFKVKWNQTLMQELLEITQS